MSTRAGWSTPAAAVLAPGRDANAAAAWLLVAVAAVALTALAVPARADEVRVEPVTDRSMTTPPRGMTMDRVRDRFGTPAEQRPPVGDPPITRWEYDRFVVYFEYQYVLHSVVKRER